MTGISGMWRNPENSSGFLLLSEDVPGDGRIDGADGQRAPGHGDAGSPGLELVRELELYVRAGFTHEEALASATIVPARLVGAETLTGSITVGKAADLVLVEGDPSKQIGDLRNTRLVVMDGKLMDADVLRTAAGFSGRPKVVLTH